MNHLKHRVIAFVFAFTPFLFSCSNHKVDSSHGVKVVLELSFSSYIKSLAVNQNDTVLNNVLDNTALSQLSNKEFFEKFIDNYIQKASFPQLLHVFEGNGKMPQLHSKNELLAFFKSDYYKKMTKMHAVIKNRVHAFTEIPENNITITHKANQLIVIIAGWDGKNVLTQIFKSGEGVQCWEVVTLENGLEPIILRLNDTMKNLTPEKKIVAKDTAGMNLDQLIAANGDTPEKKGGLFSMIQPTVDQTGKSNGSPAWGIAAIKDTAAIMAIFSQPYAKNIIPANIKMEWGKFPGLQEKEAAKFIGLYAVKMGFQNEPLIDGDDIQQATLSNDNSENSILLSMTPYGKVKWANATKKCINKPIAIAFGNYVFSAPTVINEIKVGKTSITANFTEKEASDLAKIINSGKFPLEFKVASLQQY